MRGQCARRKAHIRKVANHESAEAGNCGNKVAVGVGKV